MLQRKVHHSTAKRILKTHAYLTNTSYTSTPIPVDSAFKQLKEGVSFLLTTGAVLLSNKGKYYISGYAMDGSDVTSIINNN